MCSGRGGTGLFPGATDTVDSSSCGSDGAARAAEIPRSCTMNGGAAGAWTTSWRCTVSAPIGRNCLVAPGRGGTVGTP